MEVGGYVGARILVEGLDKKISDEIRRTPGFRLIPDEASHAAIAFKARQDNVGRMEGIFGGSNITSISVEEPIIFRTPYTIEEDIGKVVATNLHTGEKTSARNIVVELNGFTGSGFTLIEVDGAIPLRYQIERAVGGISKNPPALSGIEVRTLDVRVNDAKNVIYFDNLLVPVKIAKSAKITTSGRFLHTFAYNVNGGITVDGYFGKILERHYSNIDGMFHEKEETQDYLMKKKRRRLSLGIASAALLSAAYPAFVGVEYALGLSEEWKRQEKQEKLTQQLKGDLLAGMKLGSRELVLTAYNKQPDNPELSYYVGDFFWAQADYSLAVDYYSRGLRAGGDRHFGEYSLAVSRLANAVGHTPRSCFIVFDCGDYYWRGDRQQVLTALKSLLDKDIPPQMRTDLYQKINFAENMKPPGRLSKLVLLQGK